MKVFAILVLAFELALSASAGTPTLEEISSHFFTNGPIVWQASTDHLPKQLWIYRRSLPRVFSANLITNAIILGSFQSQGFPRPSTNQTCIVAEPRSPFINVCNFFINPGEASMAFQSPDYKNASPNSIPSDQMIVSRAWGYAPQLGLDPKQMIQKSFFTHSNDADQTGGGTTAFVCGRGVFLSRQLDGVAFFSADDTGSDTEGFAIEFGSRGQIRSFSFRWSPLERHKSQQTASLQEISRCISAHKAIVLPNLDEADYFGRLRSLATAKKLTITKITPVYGEGILGELQTNNAPCNFAIPFAELEAVADFGTSNATVRLVSPILSSEVTRLLKIQ